MLGDGLLFAPEGIVKSLLELLNPNPSDRAGGKAREDFGLGLREAKSQERRPIMMIGG